jgi:FKBP-type peptidyl-prolyl cis-trans isomerase 2
MRSWRSIKGDHAAAKPILAIIVVALLITSTVGAYAVLFAGPAKGLEAGDLAKVDYIGQFADGRVFDTSMWEVASDDDKYPKSLFFKLRGNETKYSPIEFKVGGYTMIPGFDQGVRGMKVGETRTFNVSIAQGYGEMNPDLKRTVQLEETLPLQTTMDKATFIATFGEEPASMKSVKHALLGINATVLSYTNDRVTVLYAGNHVGDTATVMSYDQRGAKGWTTEVTNMTSSSITVRHHLTEDDSFMVRGFDKVGLSYTNPSTRRSEVKNDFYVDEVDEDAGTFVMNYNSETTGRVLTFTVTLRSVA